MGHRTGWFVMRQIYSLVLWRGMMCPLYFLATAFTVGKPNWWWLRFMIKEPPEQQRNFHHVQTNFPHVHVWFMNCDRPLEKEMIIWFVSVWQHKPFLGSENCISIWHPQIEIFVKNYLAEKRALSISDQKLHRVTSRGDKEA